jgi:xylulokinase
MNFLGIDIGTSAVKAVLVDEGEAVLAEAAVPLATSRPEPGRAEQDPEEWWRASERAVGMVRSLARAGFAEMRAVGLSGQMHAALVLDEADRPIRPAILWNDGRAVAECAELDRAVPDLATIAGVVAMPGFTAPKLLWLKRHEPESFARIRTVFAAKDYIRLRLTGEFATDMADAAGTLMLDEAARAWSPRLVAASGIDEDVLPKVLEGPAWSGMLRPEVLAEWGIGHQVVVAAGAGDVAAGAIGIGAINDGDQFVSLGTSAQIFIARDRYQPKPGTLIHAFAHGVPRRWFEMAALLNGATCLEWLARVLGESDVGALIARVEQGPASLSPVTFLPYLAGERSPLNDPEARGVFAGLDAANGADDLIRAVLDGVALALRDAASEFGEAFDGAPIAMIGGGARSALWMQVVANALGRPLLKLAGADSGPAFGAARLARIAATGETVQAVCGQPPIVEIVDPDPAQVRQYAERLGRFRALYRSLRQARTSRSATADRPRRAKR